MGSQNIESIFDAKAKSLLQLYIIEGDRVGFSIPEYQRSYDWDAENIERLFEDISSGLLWRATSSNSLTFIGTIIVLNESSKEKTFDGSSLSIVDGQQRLTTISLMACSLYDELSRRIQVLGNEVTDKKVANWLREEIKYLKTQLLNFARGVQSVDGVNYYPFPRIIRQKEDNRGKSSHESEYRSIIGRYLFEFASRHIATEKKETEWMNFSKKFDFPKGSEAKSINNCIEKIEELINKVASSDESGNVDSYSVLLPKIKDIDREGYKNLFNKLPAENRDSNKLISFCKDKGTEATGLIRLFQFTSFFIHNVIATLVVVNDEKYGFDIFDSLNTTGEPLTAIQTFKPLVIQFEDSISRYSNSESEKRFQAIEKYIDTFNDNNKKQRAAKELVVSFALYKTGDKIPLNSLDEQRRYLRSNFESISKGNNKQKSLFIEHLEEIVQYRKMFWTWNEYNRLSPHTPERDLVLTCLKFLKDLNNSLSIPILCRFYNEAVRRYEMGIFTEAVKALTAFVVLRRSVTSSTANIDSDLRAIMSYGRRLKSKDKPSKALKTGLKDYNELIIIEEFKEYLIEWLGKKKIKILDKASWVNRVKAQHVYMVSAPLTRFLLLAASHNSLEDLEKPWKLKKERHSRQASFLNYQVWKGNEASTVEHIAPESGPKKGWNPNIYSNNPKLIHTLGNLTLLPAKENASLAARPWKDKVLLYKAFDSRRVEEIDKIIEEAKLKGINFGKKTEEILREEPHLPLVHSIVEVREWTKEIIEERSENIAELAWEEISPWLFG